MLQMVNSIEFVPEQVGKFREQLAELANRAAERDEPWRWSAYETRFGDAARIHCVSQADSYEEIEELGSIDQLWARNFGADEGRKRLSEIRACIGSSQHEISISRPDLSYTTSEMDPCIQFAVVTGGRARPGHADALEELFRKVSEAIPKVGDLAQMATFQTIVGDLGTYYAVRPVASLSELDQQTEVAQLLDQAFGTSEGGLVWRAGMEAVEEARREILAYVPELSNPAS